MSQQPLILHQNTLEQELLLLLAVLSPADITAFARKNNSKKYCRRGESEAEQMASKELEKALTSALTGDFRGYSSRAKRPRRMRQAMLDNDRILLAETIISHFNSYYQNSLKIVLKGREELKKQECERLNAQYKGIVGGIEREDDEEKEFENVEIDVDEKERLKAELEKKYGIKKEEEEPKLELVEQLVEQEEEKEDYIYKPVNNPTYQSHLLFYIEKETA